MRERQVYEAIAGRLSLEPTADDCAAGVDAIDTLLARVANLEAALEELAECEYRWRDDPNGVTVTRVHSETCRKCAALAVSPETEQPG